MTFARSRRSKSVGRSMVESSPSPYPRTLPVSTSAVAVPISSNCEQSAAIQKPATITLSPIAMNDEHLQSNSYLFRSSTDLRTDIRIPRHLLYSLLPPSFMYSTGEDPIMLWCLSDGKMAPTKVTITTHNDIDDLKAAIKVREEHSFRDVDISSIVVWKLNTSIPIDPADTLASRIWSRGQKVSDIATKLSPRTKLSTVFPQGPVEGDLHVIVTRETSHRKRPRSPVEEGDRTPKRIETETFCPHPDCLAIHEAIEAMPDNPDLSNPTTYTALPFPSLLPIPSQRFIEMESNGVSHFQYMGRSMFRKLQDQIEAQPFLKTFESLYLYGTSGSGKSHLLAALVYHLIRRRQRVIYIPDCTSLILEAAQTIWTALRFAFYDSPMLGAIDHNDVDQLLDFMSKNRDLYIIVDQLNALEVKENDSRQERKNRALGLLDSMRFGHRYIFSASANEISNRDADRKQSGISVFRIFGGMNEDETEQWFQHHCCQLPRLSVRQRGLVEYLTGCNPLLLSCLFKVDDFAECEFRGLPALRKVHFEVDDFFRVKYPSMNPLNQEMYLTIMQACIQGGRVLMDARNLYDLRYFYVDEKLIGHFTCGVAFETMILRLRMHDTTLFIRDSWYNAVSLSRNPFVQGFLAEQICLSSIASHGLQALDGNLGQMATATFEAQPDFTEFLSSDHKRCLYVPVAYNFKAVDGIILSLDRTARQAIIFAIQFTLSKDHKQSDEEFYMTLWPTWIGPIESAGFTVQSTFVWIDKKQPSRQVKSKLVKELRSGSKVVRPEHSVVHIGVEAVDKRLASALGLKH